MAGIFSDPSDNWDDDGDDGDDDDDDEEEAVPKAKPKKGTKVDIDLGLSAFANATK